MLDLSRQRNLKALLCSITNDLQLLWALIRPAASSQQERGKTSAMVLDDAFQQLADAANGTIQVQVREQQEGASWPRPPPPAAFGVGSTSTSSTAQTTACRSLACPVLRRSPT